MARMAAPRTPRMSVSVHRIELSPNCSLSPGAALVAFGTIAAASLFMALVFTMQGYWPVLPFAGLELAALGWAFWLTRRRARIREYVLLDEARVVVEKHGRGDPERVEFPRGWARVRLERAERRHHPSRLLIGASGRHCEIGRFLSEDDRRSLGDRLAVLLSAPRPDGRKHGTL